MDLMFEFTLFVGETLFYDDGSKQHVIVNNRIFGSITDAGWIQKLIL